jgi:hypothetical protein
VSAHSFGPACTKVAQVDKQSSYLKHVVSLDVSDVVETVVAEEVVPVAVVSLSVVAELVIDVVVTHWGVSNG